MSPQGSSQDIPSTGDSTGQMSRRLQSESDDSGGGRGGEGKETQQEGKGKIQRASRGLSGKESTCQARDRDLIPGLGRFPGEGIGHPLQYSCLENPMNREAWWATMRVTKSWTRLSD